MEEHDTQYYIDVLRELDSLETPVSDWEASFLESMLDRIRQNGLRIFPKQKAVIDRMKDKYLL